MSKPTTRRKSKSIKKYVATKPQESKIRRQRAIAVSATKRRRTKSDSKQAGIIAMLQSPKGATIKSIMTATGWQSHSVRGFLAGVARKKLKLNLVSEQSDQGRTYRVKERKSLTPSDRTANI